LNKKDAKEKRRASQIDVESGQFLNILKIFSSDELNVLQEEYVVKCCINLKVLVRRHL
jgi:hypothetical protein